MDHTVATLVYEPEPTHNAPDGGSWILLLAYDNGNVDEVSASGWVEQPYKSFKRRGRVQPSGFDHAIKCAATELDFASRSYS